DVDGGICRGARPQRISLGAVRRLNHPLSAWSWVHPEPLGLKLAARQSAERSLLTRRQGLTVNHNPWAGPLASPGAPSNRPKGAFAARTLPPARNSACSRLLAPPSRPPGGRLGAGITSG